MDTNLSALPSAIAPAPPADIVQPAPARPAAVRLIFIDNLRWVMIMFVLSMHAAVTYSGQGGWYYKEQAPIGKPELFIFVTYQAFLQSFFMGLLFFVAGYFVPGAYDKKGPVRFIRDRAFRLGLPTLLYILIIGPVTEYVANGNWEGGPKLAGNGPLWFCAALLVFCLGYALFRVLSRRKAAGQPRPFPGAVKVTGLILLIATASFFVRIPWPNGTSFYNMQFCYFSQYILFFIAGTLAYRQSWLTTMTKATGVWWGRVGRWGGLIVWFAVLILGGALTGQKAAFSGGWTGQSAGLCFWEALTGVGLSIGCLALFRERFNRQGRWAKFFSDNAFAVYVFHPPILIAITLGMAGLHWPPLVKFVVAAALSIAASFTLCASVFRRIPGLKKIL
ncbi:MAG TPA: acyltransferase family protein [Puia sp.]|jgi:surface polysaccharide O-acyltransferase-like enzyme|nr:acyltransferase family protein [Puia sp.]